MAGKYKLNGMATVVLSVALSAVAATQAWSFSQIIEHGKKIAAIESNQFTVSDGLDVWKEIGDIRAALTINDPPQWLVDRLDRMQVQLNNIEAQLIGHN